MSQLPSYRALSTSHQAFVQAYVRSGCDATKASALLHPNDPHDSNVRRGWKLMQREDIRTAIADKLEQSITKYATSRDAMVERLYELIEEVGPMPADQRGKIAYGKFVRGCLDSIAKISGLQHIRHTHEHQRSININLVGVDAQGVPIQDIKSIDVPTDPATGADPLQLPLAFPSSDPVRYTIGELLDPSNDLSIDQDPANDSTQSDNDAP